MGTFGNTFGPNHQSGKKPTYSLLLPEKLVLTPDTYVEEMDATDGWSGTFNTITVNNSEFYSGSGSLKLTSNSAGTSFDLRRDVTWDLLSSSGKNFKLWVYPHSDLQTTIKQINLFAFSGVPYADSWLATYLPDVPGDPLLIPNSWNLLTFKPWNIGSGTPRWNDISKIWARIYKDEGTVSELSFDLMTAGIVRKPSVLIMFDDGNETDYTRAYPLLKAKNMVATSYYISSFHGRVGTLNSLQLQELYANGWDIANHTDTHPLTANFTQEEYEAELETCKVFLDGLGLTRASKHVGYTGNSYGDVALAGITHWGGKTGRGGGTTPNLYEKKWPYQMYSLIPTNATSVATVQNYITDTLLSGGIPVITFHLLVDSNPNTYEWLVSNFNILLNYIESLGLQTLTIDEYHKLYSGSITVHHR